ncbi:zinc finger and BTB domain-containing protein 39 [Aplochiton taeniatus]
MRIRLQGPGHAANLLSELNRCRLSRLYCDVVIQVGNRSFVAHRAVLACAGTHFRGLFSRAHLPGAPTAIFTLEFVSPANFEKVLTFIYTGEIFTDLIDVGVLYELAERLGVQELVKACHATFPDLRGSSAPDCGAAEAREIKVDMVAAAPMVATAASVCSSSAASCSSLSSSAGPSSAAPTPAAAPSPLLLPQGRASTARASRGNHTAPQPLALKAEDVQSNLGYGQATTAGDHRQHQGSGEPSPLANNPPERAPPPGLPLPVKTEEGEDQETDKEEGVGDGEGGGRPAGSGNRGPGALAQSVSNELPSFTDSSAQLEGEVCAPSSSSSADPLDGLRVGAVEGSDGAAGEGRLLFGEEVDSERGPLEGDGEIEEHWRQLAGEIIELSDDENYIEMEGEEDEEDEEDDEDLVCVENGGGQSSGSQMAGGSTSCKACGASLPADAAALRAHAEGHLTDTGACRVCEASFPDRAAAVGHALSHVGVPLFSCDVCRQQFSSQNRLLRHRRQTAAAYTLPPQEHSAAQGLEGELQCGVCSKALVNDFQAVRDHLLGHVCLPTLSCGVCQLPQLSLCSLLWHALGHLSLAVYSCPRCACSFLHRPLLDRHMATHAGEAAPGRGAAGGERRGAYPSGGEEELRCFLCSQTFHSSSAFHYHLSLHSSESVGGHGGGPVWKRKADQPLDYPASSCSSSSPLDSSSLGKLSSLGFGLGMGFGLPDKLLQPGAVPGFPAGLMTNGGAGMDGGAGGGGVPAREKWYRCRFCGKRFAHSGEFTYHLRIHTGEKPYQCKVCLRFFRGRSTMICHLKTHAGALMYRCTVCGLYFSTLKLVSSHMEGHKGQLAPDFHIEHTFMYNDHSKESLPAMDP